MKFCCIIVFYILSNSAVHAGAPEDSLREDYLHSTLSQHKVDHDLWRKAEDSLDYSGKPPEQPKPINFHFPAINKEVVMTVLIVVLVILVVLMLRAFGVHLFFTRK